MRRRTVLKLGAAAGVATLVPFGGTLSVSASPLGAGTKPYTIDPKTRKRTTQTQRQAAAKRVKATRQAAGVQPLATTSLVTAGTGTYLVPDYFGTTPNYANSPLPSGSIVAIGVLNGGSGYSATPTVAITDAYNATLTGSATATVSATGVITGFTGITAPAGFVAPVVTITDATGAGAAALAVLGSLTGGIRKFLNSLPQVGVANDLGNYLPVAVADQTTFAAGSAYSSVATAPAADYYEIALVEYTQLLHTDLVNPTLMRGYVQIETPAIAAIAGASKHVPLFYRDGVTPILDGNGAQVYGVDKPRYLGPVIVAQRDRPIRIKFTNYLAKGAGGDFFLPVDTTIMGAGMDPAVTGATYSDNRATLHLHGGNNPWISDGTPHQWTIPAGGTATSPKGVSVGSVPDMWFDAKGNLVQANTLGATSNPGQGSLTFYYTNQQSARLLFYHDHAYGLTRLNVYAGEAAGFLIQDPVEQALVSGGTVNGVAFAANTIPPDVLPLVIQDRTFVDANTIGAQDPTWNWGTNKGTPGAPGPAVTGDLWFPHVYMPNQNPYDISGASVCGRWDYGPWFWPPYTGLTYGTVTNPYASLPGEPPVIPGTPNPSIVPENFCDSIMVNGTLYPNMPVEPAAYRFRILNACNDRTINLQLYLTGVVVHVLAGGTGYSSTPSVALSDGTNSGTGTATVVNGTILAIAVNAPVPAFTAAPTVTITDTTGSGAVALASLNTDVNMVPAAPGTWPAGWPTPDGRAGGFPDPKSIGPNFIAIGNESGFLPAPVVIPNRPVGYDYNRRSVTVLNVLEKALFLGPAERSDVVVDFSKLPVGTNVILYNDAPAPVPAFDSRIDYFTGDGDQTSTGGAPNTMPGYGPNTRTVMRFQVVASTGARPAFSLSTLQSALPKAYALDHPAPIVPTSQYNTPFAATFPTDQYVRIQDTTKTFTNGMYGITSLTLTNPGGGYTLPPTVLFSGGLVPGGTAASATASLTPTSIASVALALPNNGGAGYTSAPAITFSGGGGTGAVATATITTGGTGYSSLTPPTVTIGAPPPGGTQATASATVSTAGVITSIRVNRSGSGYTVPPVVTIAAPLSGVQATAVATISGGKVSAVLLTGPVTKLTLTNAGSGYTSAPMVTIAQPTYFGSLYPSAVQATAGAAIAGTTVAGLALTSAGSGYSSVPNVTINPAPGDTTGAGATAVAGFTINLGLKPKAIQELFDPDYGRMNATLGVEIPNTTGINQTTIPYFYIDPPTEIVQAVPVGSMIPLGSAPDSTQIWKITHNGVDTHAVHFHLFDVQLINRVGWDGMVKPPEAFELGWKETVMMNPLEDCIVAFRPVAQNLPFTLPLSKRPMDMSMPVGSGATFTNVDPIGEPATVTNAVVNFGYEYVWHCHLLGHEENDFMRGMILHVAPAPVTGLKVVSTVTISKTLDQVNLAWTGVINASDYTIQRATSSTGPWTTLGTTSAQTFADNGAVKKTKYWYQVIANNTVGYTQTYTAPVVGYPHPTLSSPPVQISVTAP